jgi:hypothetical protein
MQVFIRRKWSLKPVPRAASCHLVSDATSGVPCDRRINAQQQADDHLLAQPERRALRRTRARLVPASHPGPGQVKITTDLDAVAEQARHPRQPVRVSLAPSTETASRAVLAPPRERDVKSGQIKSSGNDGTLKSDTARIDRAPEPTAAMEQQPVHQARYAVPAQSGTRTSRQAAKNSASPTPATAPPATPTTTSSALRANIVPFCRHANRSFKCASLRISTSSAFLSRANQRGAGHECYCESSQSFRTVILCARARKYSSTR